jgi:hypothetical protein
MAQRAQALAAAAPTCQRQHYPPGRHGGPTRPKNPWLAAAALLSQAAAAIQEILCLQIHCRGAP